jgi:hypothetical protein
MVEPVLYHSWLQISFLPNRAMSVKFAKDALATGSFTERCVAEVTLIMIALER